MRKHTSESSIASLPGVFIGSLTNDAFHVYLFVWIKHAVLPSTYFLYLLRQKRVGLSRVLPEALG